MHSTGLLTWTQYCAADLQRLLHLFDWNFMPVDWASLMAQWIKNPPAVQERRRRHRFDRWVRKIPWRGHGNPVQYSCLENPMDRGALGTTVQRVAKTGARLIDWACMHYACWFVTPRFLLPHPLAAILPLFDSLILTVWISHVSGITQYLSFCDWLISPT